MCVCACTYRMSLIIHFVIITFLEGTSSDTLCSFFSFNEQGKSVWVQRLAVFSIHSHLLTPVKKHKPALNPSVGIKSRGSVPFKSYLSRHSYGHLIINLVE